MIVPTRALGRDGPQVTAIGFGAMSIGGIYGEAGGEETKQGLLDHAHEIGQHFWDTADIYGDSEDIIGRWFQRTGKRNDIFIATKFAVDYSTGKEVIRSDPEYVKEACQRSLKKLAVETIDLYYCHRIDAVTPIEKTIEAMVGLKRQGKIRYLGLSEVSAAALRRAHAVHPISAYQIEYSPFSLDIESPQTKVLETCRELGIAVVAYSPMGRGLLTGQIKSVSDIPATDFRQAIPRYVECFPQIMQLVQKLEGVGKAHNTNPSNVSLAWLLAQGGDIIPIPGTKTVKNMEANTKAATLQLSNKEIEEIRDAVNNADIKGDRYPPGMTDALFRDSPQL